MRTNWSLAALAGAASALAAPNPGSPVPYGKGNDTFSYQPSGTGVSSPAVTTIYAEGETTVTHFTTIFATVCTETEKWTSQGTVFSSTYETVSTTSSVFHHTGSPASSQVGAIGGAQATATAPAGYQQSGSPKASQQGAGQGKASITSYTTTYETVVPHEYTIVHGSSTIASSLYSPTTITTIVTKTLSPVAGTSTANAVAGASTGAQGSETAPASYGAPSAGSSSTAGTVSGGSSAAQGSDSSSAAGAASSPLQYGTIPLTHATPSAGATSSASAVETSAESSPFQYGTIPLTHVTPSLTSSDSSTASAVTSSEEEGATVTSFTTTYTTTYPVTSTVHLNGTNSTTTKTYTSQTTVTTVITTEISATASASASSWTSSFGTASYTIPVNATGSGAVSAPYPIKTGSSSSSAVSAPLGTGSSASLSMGSTSSGFVYPIGTGSSSGDSLSSTKVVPPFPIGTGSMPSFPHPTAPESSSSYSFNATSLSISAPTAPITASMSFSSASYPSGNQTTSAPVGSGTGVSSTKTTSASNTTTACTHKPTFTDFCIPCEGQPGSDPNNFCGYTAADNSYEVMPKTCRTVEYFFEMTNQTVSPDGIERMGLVINGQLPGPLIEANWGDTIVVHVKNAMQNNGTSLHFHGIRQNYTNEMDGVASITQCALAPGESMTYTFKASNYGTSWYHSHFALQTYEGIFGPMIVHGPHTADYDIDGGMIVLQDWSHDTVDSMYDAAQTVGPSPQNGPRTLDTGLINGMNVWGSDNSTNQTGSRFEMEFQPQKTYLLRVVNTAIQSTFKFHIDGHKFTVISNDFVPIVPYETDILNINIGQRYNILVKADAIPGNYWMRSDNQNACAQLTNSRDIKGIVHYSGFNGNPTSTAKNYTDECIDEPYNKLVPYAPMTAGPEDSEIHKTIVIGAGPNTPTLFKWTLDGTTFQSQWGDGTLPHIYKNGSVPTYSGNLAIEVPNLHEWVYIIVESPIPLPHPIHLHGHDFFILAQGTGAYSDSVALNTDNPPRRDVALMPWSASAGTGGYLVLAFETDNPGAWLMHCHIGWHVSMGFALQIIENLDGISKTVTDSCQLDNTCLSWNKYATANHIVVEDSGV